MEITACPSCTGAIEPLKGGKFFCSTCDVVFRITREGPRVEKIGALEQLTERVESLEKTIDPTKSPYTDPKPAPSSSGPVEDPAEDPAEDPGEETAEEEEPLFEP